MGRDCRLGVSSLEDGVGSKGGFGGGNFGKEEGGGRVARCLDSINLARSMA
jgi:hypothetical protein